MISQMWRLQLNHTGPYTAQGIESRLQLEYVSKIAIRVGQVLVRTIAGGLNFRDLLAATVNSRCPSEAAVNGLVSLRDRAGNVVEVGSSSSQ